MSALTFKDSDRRYSFLLSEAPGVLSREEVTLASSENLTTGAVIGRLTKRQAAAAIPTIVGTGNGVMSGLTFGPDVQVGDYVVTLLETSATAAFSVVAPDGTALPNGAVASAYSSSHLSFTISNAGTMTVDATYTVAVTAAAVPTLIGTGQGVVSAITLGKLAQRGAYAVKVMATSATSALEVIAPDGTALAQGKIAVAYKSDHINFSLSNAGTMTAGDYFVLIVAGHSEQAKAWSPLAVDGTQDAYGILTAPCDATDAATQAIAIIRNAEIDEAALTFASTVTAAQQTEALRQLAAAGVIARS